MAELFSANNEEGLRPSFCQLYTGHPPFQELSIYQVMREVVKGTRPLRPILRGDSTPMPDALWLATRSCWERAASDRPSTRAIADFLHSWLLNPSVMDSRLLINNNGVQEAKARTLE